MVGHAWLGVGGEVDDDLGEDDVGRSDVEAMGRVEEGIIFQWVPALLEAGERWELPDADCVGHSEIARRERCDVFIGFKEDRIETSAVTLRGRGKRSRADLDTSPALLIKK